MEKADNIAEESTRRQKRREREPSYKPKVIALIENTLQLIQIGQSTLEQIQIKFKDEYDLIIPQESQNSSILKEILKVILSSSNSNSNIRKSSSSDFKMLFEMLLEEKLLEKTDINELEKLLKRREMEAACQSLKTIKCYPSPLLGREVSQEILDQHLDKLLKEKQKEMDQIRDKKVRPIIKRFQSLMEEVDFESMGLKNVTFNLFGSTVNNFETSTADIDVSLNTGNYVNERELLRVIYECYFKTLDPAAKIKVSLNINSHIRIPLIKFEFLEENYSLDLCVNNILGVINSKLLETYSKVDSRCEKLGKLVKIWAKNNNLCNGQNSVSSYGYLLMVISYLQLIDPPVLPSLQQLNLESREPSYMKVKRTLESNFKCDEKMRFDFENDIEKIRKNFPKKNTMSLWQLMTGFFEFYSEIYPKMKVKATLSVKHGHMIPRALWTEIIKEYSNRNADNFYISLADPFDYHDPGRNLTIENETKLRERFQKIYKAMTICDLDGFKRNFEGTVPMSEDFLANLGRLTK